MNVQKPKDTDKHKHYIEHLVYIFVRDILPYLFLQRPRRSRCRHYISSPFAGSSIFCFGYNTSLSSPPAFRRCCELSNFDLSCCFNSLMTDSSMGSVELC
ncbi:hypothetical protein GW17_00020727 [Ensete ventricosum]|nr:hypothetical protein GW17_00020727 [Ensete ventricosum]